MTQTAAALQEVALRKLFRTLFFRGRAGRRPRARSTPRSIGTVLGVSLLIYGAMGAMALAFPRGSVLGFAAPLHGVTFFLLTMYVSASAGEVLFHKDEADILLHRPVQPSILLRAKSRVLVEVTWWLCGTFNLIGLAVGALDVQGGGWRFIPSHILSVGLEALFCVAAVVILYELCLRWFGREHLDRLMTLAQVGFSVGGVVIWQLTPRATQTLGYSVITDAHAWWTRLLPPFWFASIDSALTGGGDLSTWMCAGSGVLFTFALLWLAFGRLARSYGEGLQAVTENAPTPADARSEHLLLRRIVEAPPLRWWLKNHPTRAGFLLVSAYLLRDREVKLRVYPQVASALALCVAMKLRPGAGSSLGPCCCLLAVAPLNALESLRFSQQWQASDMFRWVPIAGPGPLCDGARRAVLMWLFLPAMSLVLMAACVFPGAVNEVPVVIACSALVPLYTRIPSWNGKAVPLGQPNEDMRPRNALVYVAVLVLSATVMGVTFVAQDLGWLGGFMAGEFVLLALGDTIARRRLAAVTWGSLEET